MSEKFSGVIEKLFVKLNDKTKKYSISIINQGAFYGLGLYEGKTVEVDGKVLQEGWNVEFEYSGKFKNIDMNTFKIISSEVPKEVKKIKDDKDLAIRLGNAVTIAKNFTDDINVVVEFAKIVMPKVDELRNKMSSKHPKLDAYALGARCGQVSIIAAEFTRDFEGFIAVAEQLFEEVCDAEDELRDPQIKQTQSVQKAKQEPEKKVVIDKVKEEVVESIDWDDSIPF